MKYDLKSLSDRELVESMRALIQAQREQLVLILHHLNEFDDREIAIESGFPSLFEYCVREFHYAPGEAARRIHAARAAAKYHVLYRLLERGHLSLTSISMLAPHLKWNNYRRLIRSAIGKSTREVEGLVAGLNPTAEPVERIRFIATLPVTAAQTEAGAPGDLFGSPSNDAQPVQTALPPSTEPMDSTPPAVTSKPAPIRRVHFSFTADEAFLRDVERARQLLWHKSPAGKLQLVFAEALKVLLKKIDPDRRSVRTEAPGPEGAGPAQPAAPSAASARRRRPIPRAVQSAVWRRDGGSCAFLSPDGRRCGSKSGLEFDHVMPWARGGEDDEDNLRLLCRGHNQFAARRAFGPPAGTSLMLNLPSS